MTRLALPQVTLIAVDTRAPLLAAQALLRSTAGIDFGRAILFTHDWQPRRPLPGIEVVDCGDLTTAAEYSHFILRLMPNWVRTSHVLITRWDGFVIEPWAWTNTFLAYDYIGAPWADARDDTGVGQGGFSLRSRRLLAAGMDLRIAEEHPEDVALTRTYRELLEREHGVRFAPLVLARRFADSGTTHEATFGFSGAHNLPRVLDEPTLATWLDVLPDEFFATVQARRLARVAVAQRMPALARRIIDRRVRSGHREPSTTLLDAAASVIGFLTPRHERPRLQ